jgi:hypothetical protein
MAHEHHHGITDHAPAAAVPFTDAELHTFHTVDRKEVTFVIALITSIFVTGVVIYTTVATCVFLYPNAY